MQRHAIAVIVFLLAAPCLGQSFTRAERPDVTVGEKWTYQQRNLNTGQEGNASTWTIVGIEADTIVMEDGSSRRRIFSRDWNIVENRAGDRVTSAAKPYWPRYQFPLEVGKKWNQDYESMSRGGQRNHRGQRTIEVVGVENVTVPAGTFEAFKLRVTGYYQGSEGPRTWTGTTTETLWYAPRAKRVVKGETADRSGTYYDRTVFELVSMTLIE